MVPDTANRTSRQLGLGTCTAVSLYFTARLKDLRKTPGQSLKRRKFPPTPSGREEIVTVAAATVSASI
jgi:hypothetical protein